MDTLKIVFGQKIPFCPFGGNIFIYTAKVINISLSKSYSLWIKWLIKTSIAYDPRSLSTKIK